MSKTNPMKAVEPYTVRFKHNHTVTAKVVAESTKRVRLDSGALYPIDRVERVPQDSAPTPA
ncbi:MAG TPA: hypothetical protein VHX44_06705 [Planctomycetota bacterium]|jgi:hypothetical protein|nr:hypothetical protein [Planctomycetota bacterium]